MENLSYLTGMCLKLSLNDSNSQRTLEGDLASFLTEFLKIIVFDKSFKICKKGVGDPPGVFCRVCCSSLSSDTIQKGGKISL
jgi:hypothetical protein